MVARFQRVAFLVKGQYHYFTDALQGMTAYVNLHGPWRFYLEAIGDIAVEDITRSKIDGLLLGVPLDQSEQLGQMVQTTGLPIVSLTRQPTAGQITHVRPDDRAVGKQAAQHFIERGFRNFAYVGPMQEPAFAWSRMRQEGFAREVKDALNAPVALFVDQEEFWGRLKLGRSSQALSQWLVSLPKPVAILTANDVVARRVLLATEDAKVLVPEQAAVVGVDDDTWICQTTYPPLSSIPLDGYRAGYEAARLLDGLMNGEPAPIKPIDVAPAKIVVRRSSDMLAIADEAVAAAMGYIANHAHLQTQVKDVITSVPISRRMLERRFRLSIGWTIQEEIRRVHIDRAKRLLLAEEDLSLKQIARASGFTSAKRLCEVFRRVTGQTPTTYRRQKL